MPTELRKNEFTEIAKEILGWSGHVWNYRVSLSELVIKYVDSKSDKEIYIIFNACEEFGGPVSWRSSNLYSDWQEDDDNRFKVVDEGGEYYVICGMVRVHGDVYPYEKSM